MKWEFLNRIVVVILTPIVFALFIALVPILLSMYLYKKIRGKEKIKIPIRNSLILETKNIKIEGKPFHLDSGTEDLDIFYSNLPEGYEDEYFFRASTTPSIKGIDKEIISDFCFSNSNGFLIQKAVLVDNKISTTTLDWYEYKTETLETIKDIGLIGIYVDKKDNKIKAFDKTLDYEINLNVSNSS